MYSYTNVYDLHIFYICIYAQIYVYMNMSVCSVIFDSLRPMECNCQAPLFMEFSRQEYWSGFPFSTPICVYIYPFYIYIYVHTHTHIYIVRDFNVSHFFKDQTKNNSLNE